MTTRWLDPAPVNADSLDSLNLSPLIAQTLARRGFGDPAAAKAFLDPGLYTPSPADQLPGMSAAAERVTLAIRRNERICIWGDFDVDGQTATTLLVQTLRALGANVTTYIPVRARESHGIHIPKLTEIIDGGAQLILTCDTGITAHEAVEYANSRGVDVVITDHHDPGESLPEAFAVTNPKLLPKGHPLSTLPGVGVAFKLAEALLDGRYSIADNRSLNNDYPVSPADLLDLVALGIVADVAELRGDTRYLLQRGLEQLRRTERVGLQALFKLASLQPSNLSEEHIGFSIGPRLNALGRLGDANPIVELLLTQNQSRANVLAAQIEGLNAQRQLLTSQVYRAAEAQLQADPSLLDYPVLVLSNPSWPGGVIGIAASRLVERYGKPVILLTAPEGDLARGSARSVDGVHITEAIAAQKDILRGFGGHPMAAGLALETADIPKFRERIGRTVARMRGEAFVPEPELQIDAWLPIPALTLDLAAELDRLAPFGPGNPPLVLAARNLTLRNASKIGRSGDHVKLAVEDEAGHLASALWWNGDLDSLPETGSRVDLAFKLRASDFRGQKQVQLEFVDMRVVEEKQVEVKSKGIEIRDWRLESRKIETLGEAVLVWAEGADKPKGKSRFELGKADELAIFTTPPSLAELRAALEVVKPKIVYLLGISPLEETPEALLGRLAGLAKFVVNKKGGTTTLAELAAATAQREIAVQLGLEWLAAGGKVEFKLDEDRVTFSAGSGAKNPYSMNDFFAALKGVLDESAAFRRYVATIKDPQSLFE
jgi:single-stranded-DNA-specific exonuclease